MLRKQIPHITFGAWEGDISLTQLLISCVTRKLIEEPNKVCNKNAIVSSFLSTQASSASCHSSTPNILLWIVIVMAFVNRGALNVRGRLVQFIWTRNQSGLSSHQYPHQFNSISINILISTELNAAPSSASSWLNCCLPQELLKWPHYWHYWSLLASSVAWLLTLFNIFVWIFSNVRFKCLHKWIVWEGA